MRSAPTSDSSQRQPRPGLLGSPRRRWHRRRSSSRCLCGQDQVPVRIHASEPPRWHQGGRAPLLDDGRSSHHLIDGQCLSIMDRGDQRTITPEHDLVPISPRHGQRDRPRRPGRLVTGHRRAAPNGHELDGGIAIAMTESCRWRSTNRSASRSACSPVHVASTSTVTVCSCPTKRRSALPWSRRPPRQRPALPPVQRPPHGSTRARPSSRPSMRGRGSEGG